MKLFLLSLRRVQELGMKAKFVQGFGEEFAQYLKILVKMFLNVERIPSGWVSLRPVLSSHLTLEFTVIAPCREIPPLIPFPSQPMS
jgi:hypothetical protein